MEAGTGATVVFRRTRKREWAVCGPVDAVESGPVSVTRRDGTATVVTVERTGRAFAGEDGVRRVYGYLAPHADRPDGPGGPGPDGGSRGAGSVCDECGAPARRLRSATDSSGIRGRVCRRCFGPSYTLSFA